MLDLSNVSTQLLNNLALNGNVKIVKPDSVYDPVTGVKTSTEQVIDLAAANLPVPNDLVDGTIIVASDRLVVMDGAVKPTRNDKLLIDGDRYSIEQITEVNHAGIPQLYKVVARG